MQTSSVWLAVCLSAQAVASIALISLAVNSIASELPSSMISPCGSRVYTRMGVIGSVENELVKPLSNLKRTWDGAASASSNAELREIILVSSSQTGKIGLTRLTPARGVNCSELGSTSISSGILIEMSPCAKSAFFVSKENS